MPNDGRRPVRVPDAGHVISRALDIDAADFGARLAELSPGLVIHCVGPFQGQDYRVAMAALAAAQREPEPPLEQALEDVFS